MAKLRIAADALLEQIFGPNFITLNDLTFDPVYRTVILEIVGSDVPDCDEVLCEVQVQRKIKLVPAK